MKIDSENSFFMFCWNWKSLGNLAAFQEIFIDALMINAKVVILVMIVTLREKYPNTE